MAERSFDAIILTGGSGARLGGAAKADIDIGGVTLLERALAATREAERTICVGAERGASRQVTWARERPTGGGPVAGIAAGLAHVAAEVVAVLAVDHPFVTRDHIRLLVAKASPAAWLVDGDGRAQPLVAAYATAELRRRVDGLADAASIPLQQLLETLEHVTVEDAIASRDCDTWDDVAWARARPSTAARRSAPGLRRR